MFVFIRACKVRYGQSWQRVHDQLIETDRSMVVTNHAIYTGLCERMGGFYRLQIAVGSLVD